MLCCFLPSYTHHHRIYQKQVPYLVSPNILPLENHYLCKLIRFSLPTPMPEFFFFLSLKMLGLQFSYLPIFFIFLLLLNFFFTIYLINLSGWLLDNKLTLWGAARIFFLFFFGKLYNNSYLPMRGFTIWSGQFPLLLFQSWGNESWVQHKRYAHPLIKVLLRFTSFFQCTNFAEKLRMVMIVRSA